MSIELVLLTPALVACILVIAAGARYVDARGQTTTPRSPLPAQPP